MTAFCATARDSYLIDLSFDAIRKTHKKFLLDISVPIYRRISEYQAVISMFFHIFMHLPIMTPSVMKQRHWSWQVQCEKQAVLSYR